MRSSTICFVLLALLTSSGLLAQTQEPAGKSSASSSAGATKAEVEQLRSELAAQRETIEQLKGVTQMDQLDNRHAVLLVQADPNGSVDLKTIELP